MKGFIIALQFMTRIPVNIKLNYTEKEFGRSSFYFPLVGLVIGIILNIVYKITSSLLPPLVVGALIIIVENIITGGIHIDGFMDTMDGILSARPKDKILEIMKDSRVGAHSVTAHLSLFLVKYSVVVSLPSMFASEFILLMPLIGRWYMLFCIAFFPYARNKGLGKIFWEETKKIYWFFATLILTGIILILLPEKYLLTVIITFLLSLIPTLIINKKIHGQTGDTYGAVSEISQVIFLFICLLFS